MADMTENEKRDYQKFFIAEGEPGFSPERNKAIVDSTIKKYDAMKRKRQKQYIQEIANRTDAVLDFFKSRYARSGMPIEKYFGRQWMAYLRGEKIVQEVKGRKRILSSLD